MKAFEPRRRARESNPSVNPHPRCAARQGVGAGGLKDRRRPMEKADNASRLNGAKAPGPNVWGKRGESNSPKTTASQGKGAFAVLHRDSPNAGKL